MESDENEDERTVALNIYSESGSALNEAPILVPVSTSVENLQILCNRLLEHEEDSQLPIQFQTVDGVDIVESIKTSVPQESIDDEKVCMLLALLILTIILGPVYNLSASSFVPCSTCYKMYIEFARAQATDYLRPILTKRKACLFDLNEEVWRFFRMLASGSGDQTVRLWDLTTELPFKTCEGHHNWVLCIAFSPSGRKLASACKSGEVAYLSN